jgi:hypothetical protein
VICSIHYTNTNTNTNTTATATVSMHSDSSPASKTGWDLSFVDSSVSDTDDDSQQLAPQLQRSHSEPSLWDTVSSYSFDNVTMRTKSRDYMDMEDADYEENENSTLLPTMSSLFHKFSPRRRAPLPAAAAAAHHQQQQQQLQPHRRTRTGRNDQHTRLGSTTTPRRLVALLFLLATYTTLWLPYPQDYVEVVVTTTSDMPHYVMTSSSSTATTTRNNNNSNNNDRNRWQFARSAVPNPIQFQPQNETKPLSSYARRHFYQQDAVQTQVHQPIDTVLLDWIGGYRRMPYHYLWWYAHVSLLLVLAGWVLVATWSSSSSRRRWPDAPPPPRRLPVPSSVVVLEGMA